MSIFKMSMLFLVSYIFCTGELLSCGITCTPELHGGSKSGAFDFQHAAHMHEQNLPWVW
ncbi:hypothetical protein M404DRAFT_705358 [Pisolithus tinctorius Marx 270]|uniref:Uncharacterized protein n=1 Tax=Pisolithus tinctorius Marx 270 TaxID=870435 RepID=A0A0C3JV20_PISTI|nr:hypothetical protein M404DRAFT_705358 [Pisolithus tinctorius Marx 270]